MLHDAAVPAIGGATEAAGSKRQLCGASAQDAAPFKRHHGMQPGSPAAQPSALAAATTATAAAATAADAAAVPGGHCAARLPDAPFHLMRVQGSPKWNQGFLGASLCDLVCGDMLLCVACNFMMDLGWLLSTCPDLWSAQQLVVVHGERLGEKPWAKLAADAHEYRRRRFAQEGPGQERLVVHAPRLPHEFGTHHSKAFFIEYATGVRVVIFTANAIYSDCNNKTQGLYWQDFPPKDQHSPQTSPFEGDLALYLRGLVLPPAIAKRVLHLLERHDFSAARGHIIASVPGYHRGETVHRYGHMKLRAALQAEPPWPARFRGAPIAAQFSSMGGFTDSWLNREFRASLAAGRCEGAGGAGELGLPPAGSQGLHLVWPSAGEVQNSLEGWAGGRSVPARGQHVTQPFVQQLHRRWGGEVCGRERFLPHIKSFVRYRCEGGPSGSGDANTPVVEVAWAYIGSHNLSRAAWGELQKQGTQLFCRSYELGVLLTPGTEAAYRASRWHGFCCTPAPASSSSAGAQAGAQAAAGAAAAAVEGGAGAAPSVRFVQWQAGAPQEAAAAASGAGRQQVQIPLPIPYRLPPEPYRQGEQAWVSDKVWPGVDLLGLTRDQEALFPPFYSATMQANGGTPT